MNPTLAQANAIGRVIAVGAAYGIDVDPMLQRLAPVAGLVGDFVMVSVPHTFDRIAVSTQVPAGASALDLVEAVCGPEHRDTAARLSGPELRFFGIELEARTDAPINVALHAFGARNLDSDLARLADLGVGNAAREAIRDVATSLGGDQHLIALSSRVYDDTRSWLLRIAQPNHDESECDATRARIAATGARLGITAPQLRVVASMHDMLAKNRDSHVTLRVGSDALESELGIVWSRVRWETILRMTAGFYPTSDLAPKLGALAGAFDADVAASLELVLGTREPPGMRIAGVARSGVVPA